MKKLIPKRTICAIMALLFTLGGMSVCSAFGSNAADEAYREELIAAGFPESYTNGLISLHKKHPDWTFEALDITEMSRTAGKDAYTWDYVLYQEHDASENRNLVGRGGANFEMRNFSNPKVYDSGWYQASKNAVKYMMDPRNFLTEEQIFQFYDLRYSENVSLSAVEAVCRGTFMENAKLDDIYSNMTYAEFFMELGRAIDANPVYLATVVRSEQGTKGTSPLISGECGDKLWYYYSGKYTGNDEQGSPIKAPTSGYTEDALKAYNGYYNYFNIGASGTGYFAIYLGGMKEAQKGTDPMKEAWGGSGAWNTRWKALWGGAYAATSRYIGDYQSTFYFQKFNVDPRSSRNFWGQYMQSLHGSTGRASQFYKSYKENGLLDVAYHFTIPVFEGMPDTACPAPNGSELSNTSALEGKNVASYDIVDMELLFPQKGLRKNYTISNISWRVFMGDEGYTLSLGQWDLTKYDYALIEYSTDSKFDCLACGKRSVIGLVSSADAPYGGGGAEENFSADLGHVAMTDARGSFEIRNVVKVDLRELYYNGEVFLTAYTQPDKKYMVHNVAFYTLTSHVDPEPPVTEAPVTEAPPETEPVEQDSGAILPIAAIAAAVVLVSAGAVAAVAAQKKKRAAGRAGEDSTSDAATVAESADNDGNAATEAEAETEVDAEAEAEAEAVPEDQAEEKSEAGSEEASETEPATTK